MQIRPEDIPEPPPGVTLRDPEDSDSIREDIENSMLGAMSRYVNGYSYGGVRLELKDLKYVGPKKFTKAEQQEALLSDRLLSRRLRGTVRLVNEEDNSVLDERKNFTLAHVPYLTERGTFIDNGSEFSPVMQSRLLPGAYARRRDNGELETHFNTRPGTGSAMRVSFDPTSAQYRLRVGSSDLHAYSVFRDLGVTDEELERRWGPDILEANRAKYSRHTLDRLYKKAIPKWERDENHTAADKVAAIRSAFDKAQVAESILKQNLPNLFSHEKSAHWRTAGRAIEVAQNMVKKASEHFAPDFTAEQVFSIWETFEAPLEKRAAFSPDLTPEELKETYNSIYGHSGPRLASMRAWPQHWLDDQDNQGWLQWYENYSAGRRGDTDDKQIARWKSFKARTGAQFVSNPTPRRAYALVNWGIDPIKLLPEDKAEGMRSEMERYRRGEYVKWFMNRHDFDDAARERLGRKAVARGATFNFNGDLPDDGVLMSMALEGHILPEDLK
jgi:DNA-directed RNA polymerase beta subunit